MNETISRELLTEVLEEIVCYNVKMPTDSFIVLDVVGKGSKKINIYELTHKCLVYAWENNYEITPRVMGAEVMSLKTGYQEYLVNRDDIIEPEMFDYRFIALACQWVLENKDLK